MDGGWSQQKASNHVEAVNANPAIEADQAADIFVCPRSPTRMTKSQPFLTWFPERHEYTRQTCDEWYPPLQSFTK